MGNHLKQMLMAGAAVLVALVLTGVPLTRALPYAVSLACPVMMIWMMWMMGRGNGRPARVRGPAADTKSESPVFVSGPVDSGDTRVQPIELP